MKKTLSILLAGLAIASSGAQAEQPSKGSLFIQVPYLSLGGYGSQVYGTNADVSPYTTVSLADNKASAGIVLGFAHNLDDNDNVKVYYSNFSRKNKGVAGDSFDDIYADNSFSAGSNVEFKHDIEAFDIDFSRTNKLSDKLSYDVLGGIKYASYLKEMNLTDTSGDEFHQRSDFSGFGPKIGIGANYKLDHGFSLYGDASIALIMAKSNVSYRNATSSTATLRSRDNSQQTSMDVGTRYDHDSFGIKLGYRAEQWDGAARNLTSYYGGSVQTQDLNLSGAYVETIWNF